MPITFKVSATKACEGGVDIQLSLNGVQSEGRVFPSLQAALNAVDDNPMTVDDLLWIVRRCAKAQGLTPAQIRQKTLVVDFTLPNVVTFS